MEVEDKKFQAFKTEFFQFVSDENRVMRDYVDQRIQASETKIIEAVGEMLDGSILLQIDDLDHRVRDIDRRVTKLEAKSV